VCGGWEGGWNLFCVETDYSEITKQFFSVGVTVAEDVSGVARNLVGCGELYT